MCDQTEFCRNQVAIRSLGAAANSDNKDRMAGQIRVALGMAQLLRAVFE
eukprot:SAG31_NODE_36506_length_312_cov_1.901408_1_plen_48_part_10